MKTGYVKIFNYVVLITILIFLFRTIVNLFDRGATGPFMAMVYLMAILAYLALFIFIRSQTMGLNSRKIPAYMVLLFITLYFLPYIIFYIHIYGE